MSNRTHMDRLSMKKYRNYTFSYETEDKVFFYGTQKDFLDYVAKKQLTDRVNECVITYNYDDLHIKVEYYEGAIFL